MSKNPPNCFICGKNCEDKLDRCSYCICDTTICDMCIISIKKNDTTKQNKCLFFIQIVNYKPMMKSEANFLNLVFCNIKDYKLSTFISKSYENIFWCYYWLRFQKF